MGHKDGWDGGGAVARGTQHARRVPGVPWTGFWKEPTFWRPCCVHVWGPASCCPVTACWFHGFPTLGACTSRALFMPNVLQKCPKRPV